MDIKPAMFLIVCPLLFLAGFVDAIGGGGGLISLPAYLMAGLPPHMAIATNKCGAFGGSVTAAIRFTRNKCVQPQLAVLSVVCAMIGSSCGARLSLIVPETVLKYILLVVLPITAAIVLNRNLFKDNPGQDPVFDRRTCLIVAISALLIGAYDGFYGPGTGTFLIIAFTIFAKMNIRHANGHAKIINATTNVTSLVVFLLSGNVIIILGIAGCICNIIGSYIGSGLVLENGSRIVRPIIVVVLVLLFIKVLVGI